jgi:hypothetical protein
MSLYKLPPSAIIDSFSESYAVMVNHLPLLIRDAICLIEVQNVQKSKHAEAAGSFTNPTS